MGLKKIIPLTLFVHFLLIQNSVHGLPISSLTGSYRMTKSENFSAYMDAVGTGWWLKLLGANAKPDTDISEKDGTWKIKTTTTFKETNIEFKLGVPFKEVTADGRTCQATITRVEDSLIQKQICDGKEYEIIRKFDNHNGMTMTLTAPGPVVARRVYVKK